MRESFRTSCHPGWFAGGLAPTSPSLEGVDGGLWPLGVHVVGEGAATGHSTFVGDPTERDAPDSLFIVHVLALLTLLPHSCPARPPCVSVLSLEPKGCFLRMVE